MKRHVFLFVAAIFLLVDALISLQTFRAQRVVVAGSSCMGRLGTALSEAYAGFGVSVEVQLGGSELGLENLRQGLCDIASCSRALTEAERKDFFGVAVATDAIAAVVHAKNPVTNLTRAQLCEIYSGGIDNWQELGGPFLPIIVVGREAGSGTREAFESGISLRQSPIHGLELSETGMVRTIVAQMPGAIGYLSAEYVGEWVHAIAVDGALPDADNVLSGRYALTRPLLFCVRQGDFHGAAWDFVQYAQGDTGRGVIASLGMTPAPKGGFTDAHHPQPL